MCIAANDTIFYTLGPRTTRLKSLQLSTARFSAIWYGVGTGTLYCRAWHLGGTCSCCIHFIEALSIAAVCLGGTRSHDAASRAPIAFAGGSGDVPRPGDVPRSSSIDDIPRDGIPRGCFPRVECQQTFEALGRQLFKPKVALEAFEHTPGPGVQITTHLVNDTSRQLLMPQRGRRRTNSGAGLRCRSRCGHWRRTCGVAGLWASA